MDTLKSLLIALLFTFNCFCHAKTIKCSICCKKFEYGMKGSSGTICAYCKTLINTVKIWKQACPECRKYVFLDLCPNCLDFINNNLCGECEKHQNYVKCLNCFKSACANKVEYNGEESPNCLEKLCKNPIDPKGCYGYFTGLCAIHNEILMKTIKDHKEACKCNCKRYPFLDLCPECIEIINNDKSKHDGCIWEKTPYDVYVPCTTCLSCFGCH